jgi:hypothetical protein
VSIAGLPAGIEVAGQEIPAGATIGLLTLTASESPPVHALGKIIARGENAMPPRTVLAPENDVSKRMPWLREELAFSLAHAAPVSVAWADNPAMNGSPFLLGAKVPLAVTIRRREGAGGKVRLRLLTTQVMPRKTIKENNRGREVDDLERALRLDGDMVLTPDVSQTSVTLVVPPDLPDEPWGMVVVGELLDADDKTVVATTATTAWHFRRVVPSSVELAGSLELLEARAGSGETGVLRGNVRRHSGFSQPVTITLHGLPKEYAAPTLTVPGDRDEFALEVRFPFGVKPAELKDVKLVALFQPDPKNSALAVRSNEIAVGLIKVVPGEPPPPEANK